MRNELALDHQCWTLAFWMGMGYITLGHGWIKTLPVSASGGLVIPLLTCLASYFFYFILPPPLLEGRFSGWYRRYHYHFLFFYSSYWALRTDGTWLLEFSGGQKRKKVILSIYSGIGWRPCGWMEEVGRMRWEDGNWDDNDPRRSLTDAILSSTMLHYRSYTYHLGYCLSFSFFKRLYF